MVAWVVAEAPVVEEVVPEEEEVAAEVAVEVVLMGAWVDVMETGSAPTRHVATTTFRGVFSATGVQPHVTVALVAREVPIMDHQACEVV